MHRLLILGIGILVVTAGLLIGGAWRLSEGPIDLRWVADRVRTALLDDTAPVHVSFSRLALAWEGFHKGVDYPIDLRASDIVVTDPAGIRIAVAPDAHLTLSLAGLLLGRIVPRAIEVDHAQVAITRDVTGAIRLGSEPASTDPPDTGAGSFDLGLLRHQLIRPVSTDHGHSRGWLDQLQRAHLRDAEITFLDRASATNLNASDSDIDLSRTRDGRIHGVLRTSLASGDARMAVTMTTDLVQGADSKLAIEIAALQPRAIGSLHPDLAPLSHIDLPVSLQARTTLDMDFRPTWLEVTAQLGRGQILIGKGALPVATGGVAVSGTMNELKITHCHLDLVQNVAAPPESIDVVGILKHVSDRIALSMTARFDQIAIADLPRLWPVGIGGGARPWITEHITGGMARHGTMALVIEADDALRDVVITKANGEMDAANAAFTWLDDMPPIEQADVHLRLATLDTLEIHLNTGRQRVNGQAGNLLVKDGTMRIAGLSLRDQTADIHIQIEGQILNALALLGEPRLHLLSAHPIALKPAGGDVAGSLDVRFPLQADLQVDDVFIHADAHLVHLRVPDIVGRQELGDGTIDLAVDKDGLKFKGAGSLAMAPMTLEGRVDFTSGPPDQIIQKITVTGQPSAAQLDAAGLPVTALLDGPVPLTALVVQRRSGDGSVSIDLDLAPTALKIRPLAWRKPPGTAAKGNFILILSRDRLLRLDRFALQGENLFIGGSASVVDGHLRSVLLDRIQLGRTQGHGTINLTPSDRIDLVLQGSQIDLAPKLTEKSAEASIPPMPPASSPSWTLNARFDHAMLANGENAANLLAKVTGEGDTVRTLDAVGASGAGERFSLKIEPRDGVRHLLIDAKDAGRFLRGMDVIRVMQSGHLVVDAGFEQPDGFYPVAGSAVIRNVVIRNSPILGKILQAMTVYGLVDALRGPGMAFSNIVIPFRFDGMNLTLSDAHANNASLGLTGKGQINIRSGQTGITGTIVPAYFFNSMLGQLPWVGKFFSPEKGGGVFAARFGVGGSIEDPTITINPVSALTPGFMREIFSIFESPNDSPRAMSPHRP